MKKITPLLLLASSIIPVASIVSCSDKKSELIDDLNFQNKINKYFEDGLLYFNFKNPVVTEKIFEENKSNKILIKKAFQLTINPKIENEELDFNIISIIEKKDKDRKIQQIEIEIFNKKNEKAKWTENLIFTPSSEQNYTNQVYNYFVDNKLTLKNEYKDEKINKLFKNVKSDEEFLDKYINKEILDEFLGIRIKLKLPTQSINFKNGFKINILLFDEDDKQLIPTSPKQPYLELKNDQIIPITILKQSDVEKDNFQTSEYFGETFFLKDKNTNVLFLKSNFQNKNIINELDFSLFSEVIFDDKTNFSNNKINSIKFNRSSTVKNIKTGLFKNNKFNDIYLPNKIIDFNIGAFDENVEIHGIESIDFIEQYYDKKDKDLYLNRAKSQEEIQQVFNIFEKSNLQSITFNKIYLPPFDFNYQKNVKCNQIIFNQEREQNVYEFKTNLSKWNIQSVINISDKIIKIKKEFLPEDANKNRKLNSQTLKLIEGKRLDLSKKININQEELSLFQHVNDLNDFFWSNTLLEIDEVILNNDNSSSILNFPSITNKDFFIENKIKKITIPKKFEKINNEENFYFFKKELKVKSILIDREINDKLKFINFENKVLKVNEFYNYLDSSSITNNINQFLVGYEEYINTIEMNNVTEIRNSLFKNLNFNNVNLDMSNITKINDYAFQKTIGINFNTSNFKPTEIGNSSFENSSLSGNIDFSKVNKIGSKTFYNTELNGEVNLSNLDGNKINEYTFYGTKINKVILSQSTTIISNSAFSNTNKLTDINLDNLEEIQESSFSNSGLIKQINISKVTKLGSRAFYNTKITGVIFSDKLDIINDFTFYNSNLKEIDFKNVTKIGSQAFNGNLELKTIDLKKIDNIGFGAFSHVTNVNNFNFEKLNLNIFTNFNNEKIIFNNTDNIYQKIGYVEKTKTLDLSEKTFNNELENYLKIFFNKKEDLNEIILFNSGNIDNKFILMLKGLTIKKMTWNYEGAKNMNFNLSGIKINELNENFLAGVDEVPENAFLNCGIEMNQLNLINVKTIGNSAFNNNKIKKFINTDSIIYIGSYSFNNNVEFQIFENVKLKNNSFGGGWKPNDKIQRNNIFSSNNSFSKIYNQESKILDFSLIQINKPWSREELQNYLNINEYLLDGDVKTIILPKTYVIFNDLFNNLGSVDNIVFQMQNQQILINSFLETKIKNKPDKSSTNIIYDEDNFFN